MFATVMPMGHGIDRARDSRPERRKDPAFVKVNCLAIPTGLLGRDFIIQHRWTQKPTVFPLTVTPPETCVAISP